jgi:hypothetical protein
MASMFETCRHKKQAPRELLNSSWRACSRECVISRPVTYPESESFPWIKEGSGMYYEDGVFVNASLVVQRPDDFLLVPFREALRTGDIVWLGDLPTRSRDRFYNQTPTGYPQAGLFWSYLENRHPSLVASLIAGLNARSLRNNAEVIAHITGRTGLSLAELDAAYVAYALSW